MSVTQCRACAPGTTSGEGAAKCWKCPRGRTAWPGSGRCVACNAGYAVVPPCVPGVPFPRAPACVKCPRGMYSDKRNALTCSQCPEGTTTAIVGASNKEMCRPCGTTTLLHGVSFGCSCRNTTIASTSFGTAEERAGLVLLPKHALQLLPLITVPTSTDPALDALAEPRRAVSSYRPVGDAICTRCPPGSRALSEYATNSSECTPCPRGTHYEYLRGCMPCPSGMHSFGTGASACRFSLKGDCPTGTFTDRSNVCKACPPGYEKHNRQCRRCEPGYVSFGGSGQCVKCEKPMVARPNGQGPCVCGRGRYYRPSEVKEGRKKTCLKCPKGTWIGRRFHTERECVRTCERKVLGLTGTCGKCKVGYRRRRREEGGGCVKCERGLETVFGMERCGRFDLKCEKDEMMFVSPGLLGYSWTCRKIRF